MIDLQNIADNLGFELDDVQMLMEMFLENANQSLEELNRAIEAKDFFEIKNASHAIKGSSANLMLEDITSISSTIEELAQKKSDANYKKLSFELKNRLSTLEEMKVSIC